MHLPKHLPCWDQLLSNLSARLVALTIFLTTTYFHTCLQIRNEQLSSFVRDSVNLITYCLSSQSLQVLVLHLLRKEKSTPVGVGYGRPWTDQWLPGP